MKENRRTLIDFLEKALEVGADSIEVESRKSKRATLGGVPYRIVVSQQENFGDWIYRIKWNPASADTGAARPRTATSKRAR